MSRRASLDSSDDGGGAADGGSSSTRRRSSTCLNPYMYPPGSFHMPTIVDAPRKRKGIADYYLVSKLRSSAPPKERHRAAPERLNMAVWGGGPPSKRTKVEESDESATSAAAASSSSTAATNNTASTKTNKSATKSTSVKSTSGGGDRSTSGSSSKSSQAGQTGGGGRWPKSPAAIANVPSINQWSKPPTGAPPRPTSAPPQREKSTAASKSADATSATSASAQKRSTSSKPNKPNKAPPAAAATTTTSSTTSSSAASASAASATPPPPRAAAAASPAAGAKKTSATANNADATSTHAHSNTTVTATTTTPVATSSAGNGTGSTNNAASNALKRLALERLDMTRSRSGGALADGLRHTRLAAAASMVVEADFSDENALQRSSSGSGAPGSSPIDRRLLMRSPTAPSPPPARTPPEREHASEIDDDLSSTGSAGQMQLSAITNADASIITIRRISGDGSSTTDDLSSTYVNGVATPARPSALPDCFTGEPVLSESALRRLALSNTNKATYLSFEWVHKRCQKYLALRTPDAQRAQDELVRGSTSKEFTAKTETCGTLANGRLYVAVSKQSDHNLLWLDEQSKAEANRAAALLHPKEHKWIQMRDEDDVGLGGENGSSKAIPMLGLFAAQDIQENAWLTEYGGVLEWAGNGEGSVKNRARECNTHVRRICSTDYVWNGRPWSLLFPRIPSFLEREMQRPLEERTRLTPTVTYRTLINLLLLLHHEEQTHTLMYSHTPHDRQKNSQLPFTTRDMRAPTVCQGTCLLCRNEMNIVLNGLGGRSLVGDLTHDDLLATFLPQCACCSVTVGLLPCEIHAIFSKWTHADQEALWKLCDTLQREWIANGGLGYMANTDSKARQNVRVLNKSPYVPAVSDMHPLVHIYQATRFIAEGEEIIVAYNNNFSRNVSATGV